MQVNIRFPASPILGVYLPPSTPNFGKMLQISCARQFLAITIYSILPNFSTRSDIANSAVKMGLPEKLVSNTNKVGFALSLCKFCPSQKLARHQTFLKFSGHCCRYQY